MSTQILSLEAFATKEIALSQKPIAELLKEHEGVVIQYSKTTVKKNLNALVKKHSKEIAELTALEILTVKQETRLTELRKFFKDSRIALGKITTHNSSVLAAASKHSKEIKDELVLIVQPVETKITERLDAEETRREKARNEKEEAENLRTEKIETFISDKKEALQQIINKTKTYESIDGNKKEYLLLIEQTREALAKKEFDLAELEVYFDTMLTTQAEAFQAVITSLTNAYNVEKANNALEVQKLTNERMNELFDYNFRYKGEVALGELDDEEYAEVMIPARTAFRIKQLEELGLTKSVDADIWLYIPNDSIMLCSMELETFKKVPNGDFNFKLNKIKLEIEEYNAPAPAVVEEVKLEETVDSSEKVVETPAAEATEEKHVSYSIQLQGETKSIPEPVTFEPKETPLNILLKFIDSDKTNIEIVNKIATLFSLEREFIIDAYNDGQTDTINIVIGEIEKEQPGLITEEKELFAQNVNKMDAVDYFNNKFQA